MIIPLVNALLNPKELMKNNIIAKLVIVLGITSEKQLVITIIIGDMLFSRITITMKLIRGLLEVLPVIGSEIPAYIIEGVCITGIMVVLYWKINIGRSDSGYTRTFSRIDYDGWSGYS